jgi:Asparagine synthase
VASDSREKLSDAGHSNYTMETETKTCSLTPELFRFRRQWIVGAGVAILNPAWQSMDLTSGHTLIYHPDLRVSTRRDGDRQIVVLGTAIHTAASCTPPLSVIDKLDRESIVLWLLRLAGRYAVLFSEGRNLYLYTDPAGMMGVFHTSAKAASTPRLLLRREDQEVRDTAIRQELEENFFPGTMCAHSGVNALMANHELHLNSGVAQRFWSPAPCQTGERPPIQELCELLERIVIGLRSSGQLLVSLTGGKDSRVVLAAVRAFAAEVRFFTILTPRSNDNDARYSSQLAVKFRLRHEVVRSQSPPEWVTSAYDEIGGGMLHARTRHELDGVRRIASSGCVHVGGFGGEVLRAQLWPSRRPKRADTMTLTRQAFSCAAPSVVDAVDQWRRSVHLDTFPPTVFDLFEFEQRSGRSAGIVEACSSLFHETVLPFNSRELFQLIQRVPLAMRYAGTLNAALIRTMWPQLLEVPFTQSGRPWWGSLPKPMKAAVNKYGRIGKRWTGMSA